MVYPSKATKRSTLILLKPIPSVLLKTLIRILLPFAVALVLFLVSVSVPDKDNIHNKQPNTKVAFSTIRLPVWNDDSFNTTTVPTGAYHYKEGLCRTKHYCKVYFPDVDLADIIDPESHHTTSREALNSNTNNTTFYQAPKLRNNYSQYSHDSALLTRCGNKGHSSPNQDRIVMLQHGQEKILALFDGHGRTGHVVAHLAVLGMMKRLLKGEIISKSLLSSTFLELDQALPWEPSSGSTAIVLSQQGLQVHVANLGDSLAFIARCNLDTQHVEVIYRTQSHKPHMAAERSRIIAAGGSVYLPEHAGESSRVIIPVNSREQLALAMSRSLGDQEGKRLKILSAEPTVDQILLDPDPNTSYFAVVATDGIFDCISLEDVAEHVGRLMLISSSTIQLVDVCEQIVVRASNCWREKYDGLYQDDISMIVSRLETSLEQSAKKS